MNVPYRQTFLDNSMRIKALEVLEMGLPSYGGEETEQFEVELAATCDASYGVVTNSGTSALLLILLAAKIGLGDEVLLGANDYVGCLSAVIHVGAAPVFVDTEGETGNMCAEMVSEQITDRTRAIIVTHLYGLPCDLDALTKLAHERGLLLIEDFAHALGAKYRGQPVGSFGHAGFCSFSGKHITVFGPGGVAVCHDENMAEVISSLRDQGRNREKRVSFVRRADEAWYDQERVGLNLHLSEISAALGRLQLTKLQQWHSHRRQAASYYRDRFRNLAPALHLPSDKAHSEHAYLHYSIQTSRRDELHRFLATYGIETQIHYPKPLHLLTPVRTRWNYEEGAYPNAERVASRILSLPVGPHMSEGRLAYVADAVTSFFEKTL